MRILVVEDYEPLRQLVCCIIEEQAGFEIIAQAADGLEAVQKAEELQPDSILLDLDLPRLNGIAAARQIGKLSPKSKILFLSQDTDAEIVKAALRAGGKGYVVKWDAGDELFEAMETVIQGGQFVFRALRYGTFRTAESIRTHANV